MIKEAIAQLIDKRSLTKNEAYSVMKEIMSAKATPSQMAGFLVALRNKGETVEELAGFALSMRDAAFPLALTHKYLVDNCGTGGDGQGSLNISTAAAFVAAGAGLNVAKHGNRSVSSRCGSADVLEMLGVRIDPPPAVVEQSINSAGIGFLFAPIFHTSMKNVMPTRKELGIRTIFNLLGPLTNPAKVQVQLIGVFDKALVKKMALVLRGIGLKGGLVVHSHGWDEITLDGPTSVAQLFKGKITTYEWKPGDFGLPRVPSKELRGGDAVQNARRIRDILEGKNDPAGPVVIANAAALIWIALKTFGPHGVSLKEAVRIAQEAVDSGKALHKLKEMTDISHTIN